MEKYEVTYQLSNSERVHYAFIEKEENGNKPYCVRIGSPFYHSFTTLKEALEFVVNGCVGSLAEGYITAFEVSRCK